MNGLYAVIGAVVLISVLLVLDFSLARITGGERSGIISSRIDRRRNRRHAAEIGCVERFHWRDRYHGACRECGEKTCNKGLVVDDNLRRRRVFICGECSLWADQSNDAKMRAARRRDDWSRLTEPVDDSALVLGQFPEQYAGKTRATVRAFSVSAEDEAIVDGISSSTLNGSIASLGLQDEMYAETRDGATVLRRIGKDRVR